MARSESFQCDVCSKVKSDSEIWWLSWVDCFQGENPGEDQPLLKLTRWHRMQAHAEGVKHLRRDADGSVDLGAARESRGALRGVSWLRSSIRYSIRYSLTRYLGGGGGSAMAPLLETMVLVAWNCL
jgi:hypothetical protein